ncbi:aminotransferase class I/II-fold pyridoxal phosphate-dependent enzyme [Sanguibacter sp. HDW7]|nr:aminotransferase class I/II-fold pyridoxal phosphate-dependent enzyme [Sanguibacter sp. HDW7]
MDVPLAEPIVRAVSDLVASGDTGYPAAPDEYVAAFSAFAAARWGWQVDTSLARVVPDILAGLSAVIEATTDRGDTILVPSPVYGPFFRNPRLQGRVVEPVALTADGRLDVPSLETAFAAAVAHGRRAAVLLSNPHNPTGAVHTRGELEALAAAAARHGVVVISDEAHAPLVHDGATFVPYVGVDPRGFSVLSAAKTWNLAGFKAAVVVAGTDAREIVESFPVTLFNSVGHVSLVAQAAAFRDGEPWLDELLPALTRSRDLLADLVAEHLPHARMQLPESTYLAWVDLSAYGAGDNPAAQILERGRVALSAGTDFGPGGEGHVRVNFATHPEILTEAVQRIAGALA